jgi:hypothetical protein
MTRLRAIAPILVAAALATVAVVTVQGAGCDDPARYELGPDGYHLVGGCLAPGDLMVPEQAPPAQPADAAEAPAKG